jgi:hypothetical protein
MTGMRISLLSLGLALPVAASASGAVIHVNEIKTIPRIDGLVTTAGRPSVHNGIIVFGQTAPNNVGVTYYARTGVLETWGGTENPVDITRNVAGFFQNEQTGIGGKWAVVGGAPETQSLIVPIKVINLESKTRIDVFPDPAVASGVDQHFFDINANGDLVWVNFISGTETGTLMWANMADPSVQVALPTIIGGTSQHPRISSESGRRITYSPSSTTHRVFDLETMTDHLVYESTTGENVLRSRISDDGNWIIANHRPAGETQKKSDLILVEIKDLDKPVSFNLTEDPTVIREDPNIEIVDEDTAIVVWGQDSTPEVEDGYDIYAAILTGLSTHAPVLGTPVLLAENDGLARGNRFPVIDGDLVAWSYHWGDANSQTVQYMWISEQAPEPIPVTRVVDQRMIGDAFELTFQTAAGFRYTVEFTDALGRGSWSSLPAVMGTGSDMTVTHPPPLPSACFYRVKVERP